MRIARGDARRRERHVAPPGVTSTSTDFRALAMPALDQNRARARAIEFSAGARHVVRLRATSRPTSRAISGMFGVTTAASGSSFVSSASTTSGAPRLSPEVATSTGSSTMLRALKCARRSATTETISPVASIPIFTASTSMSSKIASIWRPRKSAGGVCTALTPTVFCAVSAVIAAMP